MSKKTDVDKPIIITNKVLQLIAEEPLHQFDPEQWMIAYKALRKIKSWRDHNYHLRRGNRLEPPMRDVYNFFYYQNKWKEELGACVDPSRDCAPGLHLATKSWLREQCGGCPWYEAHFQYKDIACVPKKYCTMYDYTGNYLKEFLKESEKPIVVGKFRVFRFKLGKQIKGKV